MTMPAERRRRQPALDGFGAGAADVEANEAGRLGPRQLARLDRTAGQRLMGASILVAGPPLLVMLTGLPGWLDALALAGLGWGLTTIRGLIRARRDGIVGCLAGPVRVMLLFRHARGWWVTVEGRSFRLPVGPDELENGAPYRVYYLRAGHRIVAMTPAPELAPQPRTVLPRAG